MFTVRLTTYPQGSTGGTGTVRGFEFESYTVNAATGVAELHGVTGFTGSVVIDPRKGDAAFIMNRYGSTVETVRTKS